jgi:asparagine synthase (glutamine-hydrolysing)
MILAQGEPFGSTSIYAQYRVFQLAKEHGVTVTLDGQGADEMLAGYNGYPGQRMRSLIEKGHFVGAWSFLNEWAKWPDRSRLAGAKRAIGEFTPDSIYDALRLLSGMHNVPAWIDPAPLKEKGVLRRHPRMRPQRSQSGRRVVAHLAQSLTQRGLQHLLRHGDRNSMRFSVESRVPFLTIDMVNLLLSLPESYLISPQGETKHVFRAAMRGIVPDDILDRRDKIGFETPEKEWMMSMASTIRDWLQADLHVPFFNQAEVLREFDQIVAGKRPFSWQVWRWVNFSRWHSHVGLS